MLFLLSVQLSAQLLSETAEVSLITYSPSRELYTAFGHNALRVRDPVNQLDLLYNYGMFSFEEGNFYLMFAQGKLRYWLGAYDFHYLEQEYLRRNSTMREQVLNLTREQKQAIFDLLHENLRPENRFYLYDFFFDNCATRIRDVIEQVLGTRLRLDITFRQHYSFRNLIDLYLTSQPWGDFGIDLALGARIDRPATAHEYLFLPDFVAQSFSNSQIWQNDHWVPLVKKDQLLYQKTSNGIDYLYWQPVWVFTTLLGLILLVTLFTHSSKPVRWPDQLLLGIYGILGIFLLLLWFATDHQMTKENYNLLWAHPFHLLTILLLARPNKGLGTKLYLLVNGIWYLLLLAFWKAIPQAFHEAALPLIILLAFRYCYWYMTVAQLPVSATILSRKKLRNSRR